MNQRSSQHMPSDDDANNGAHAQNDGTTAGSGELIPSLTCMKGESKHAHNSKHIQGCGPKPGPKIGSRCSLSLQSHSYYKAVGTLAAPPGSHPLGSCALLEE